MVQIESTDMPQPYPSAVRVIDAGEQFDLAAYFLSRQDYNRAITEFERFCFYFPNDERFFIARYNIGMSHFQLSAYAMALRSLTAIAEEVPPTRLFYKASFLISECMLRLGERDRAITQLSNLAATANTQDVADEANYRLGWIHLEDHHTDAAIAYFARIKQTNRQKLNTSGTEKALKEIDQLHLKRPELAGVLSVVPGAGYLYTERYQDALISFLVNGLLFWATYEAFDHDLPALGCLAGLAGAGFYTGSIYGSVSSAYKYNRNAYDAVLNRYRPSFTIGIGVDPERRQYLLGIHFHF